MSLEIYKTYVRFHELGDSQTVQQLFSAMSLVMCKPYVRSHKPRTLCFTMVMYTAHTLSSQMQTLSGSWNTVFYDGFMYRPHFGFTNCRPSLGAGNIVFYNGFVHVYM